MRTNIDIDDALMAEAMKAGDFPTKKAAVEAALRELVANEQRRKALRAMRGLGWDGDLDQMRQDRTPVHAAEPGEQFTGEPK
ncbi:type II toxin-antitoxin system VapB family antitoxin [Tianweitania sp. BSSL-BM11]|uniref:Type II toxin-antitoxin system VapB family antitoxin n=1 Tax=Tianweitania aestuarii TaxID=2814886 RepID=A0ABS5RYV3_9HYPH|nr:type II toxin-antitoxin system VapB family antitoxin [Tianweitania aestuarii]